jgi:hypothetical protein
MIRTILSSFCFLYPIQIAYDLRDRFGMNANILALAISVINHSHTHHPCETRRNLFSYIDQCYMSGLFGMSFLICFRSAGINNNNNKKKYECVADFIRTAAVMFVLYIVILKGYRKKIRNIEEYSPLQKNIHVLFHFFSILRVTSLYKKYASSKSLGLMLS